MFFKSILTTLLLVSCLNAQADIKVYYGNLHAHSNLSDGLKTITPQQAYDYARNKGKLDFLSLSEHNHYLDSDEWTKLKKVAKQKNVKGKFIALYGQEYSTIEKGYNHSNIQNYPVRIEKSLNGQYKKVFGTMLPAFTATNEDHIIVAEFNHPKDLKTDFGFKKYYNSNWSAFVDDMDPYVQLIAIGSGPADSGNMKGFVQTDDNDYIHQDIKTKYRKHWFEYLAHGMHLAPKSDHDTHSKTYGTRMAARTAVWIDGTLSKTSLLQALADRHVYVTEDRNLEIIPEIGLGNGLLPGDIILPEEDTAFTVTLNLTDPDEPDAEYEIAVYEGVSGSGEKAVNTKEASRSGNGAVHIQLHAEQDIESYFVIHILQNSPDPDNSETKNDAWLAPIWISWEDTSDDDISNDETIFLGSVNSRLYHYPSCSTVNNINSQNLRQYTTTPENKTLHNNCPL